MKLLLVFPFFPYPPTDGGRIGFFNPIKYLSRSHEIAIVCLATQNEDLDVSELKRYCSEVYIYRYTRNLGRYRLAQGLFLSPPGSAAKYWHPSAGDLIRHAVAVHRPDIVEFHHLNTAAYRPFVGNCPAILREHNVEHKIWKRFSDEASSWSDRLYSKWSAPRVKDYESRVASWFDRCITVSPADASHLKTISASAKVEVIPSGVDTEYFYPMLDMSEEPFVITLTGSFDWKPKQQSLKNLLTNVFPRIRQKIHSAKLVVAGKGVPKELMTLGNGMQGVQIVGPVPDVRPYIARASLVINYLECGGGIALKVLEAMAMRKPVLCTSMGCEGIPAIHGEHIYIANDPNDFADAAVHLLKNDPLRRKLAEYGQTKAIEQYSWHAVSRQFTRCYEEVLSEHQQHDFAGAVSVGGG